MKSSGERTFVLARTAYARLVAHAWGAVPAEAVGLLAGVVGGRATVAFPLKNLGGQRAFIADPRSQFEAEREIRRAGLAPLAVYHSHPGGGIGLSQVDLDFARKRPLLQLIVALPEDGTVEQAAAYRIDGTSVTKLRLEID